MRIFAMFSQAIIGSPIDLYVKYKEFFSAPFLRPDNFQEVFRDKGQFNNLNQAFTDVLDDMFKFPFQSENQHDVMVNERIKKKYGTAVTNIVDYGDTSALAKLFEQYPVLVGFINKNRNNLIIAATYWNQKMGIKQKEFSQSKTIKENAELFDQVMKQDEEGKKFLLEAIDRYIDGIEGLIHLDLHIQANLTVYVYHRVLNGMQNEQWQAKIGDFFPMEADQFGKMLSKEVVTLVTASTKAIIGEANAFKLARQIGQFGNKNQNQNAEHPAIQKRESKIYSLF